MFIRQTKKQRKSTGKVYYQFSLVQSVRIDGKSRQRTILYLGSDEELRDKTNRKLVLKALEEMITGGPSIFSDIPEPLYKLADTYYQKYQVKYEGVDDPIGAPPKPDETSYEPVAIDRVETTHSRSFGPEHLCLQALQKLKLKPVLLQLGLAEDDVDRALISIAARAIYRASEHKTADILRLNSSLKECFGYEQDITHEQLYRIAEMLYANKQQIDQHLHERTTSMFDLDGSLVIFDISNTYFETRKAASELATYGRSNQKRNDCSVDVFTGVINAEGFISHSRIYESNTPDQATLSDMIEDLEHYSGDAQKTADSTSSPTVDSAGSPTMDSAGSPTMDSTSSPTIVIDDGIASEDNLELLSKKGYHYVCVSRKKLKHYPTDALRGQVIRKADGGKRNAQLSVFVPEDYPDTWMLVESQAKKAKDQSMRAKLRARFEADLEAAEAALHKKDGTKRIDKVWQRIVRCKERHRHVSGSYKILVSEKDGKATAIDWEISEKPRKDDKNRGRYFIRTNLPDPQEGQLWDIYNTIRQVESTFRCLKSDLNIRPVYHQNDERTKAHLYLDILAYQMVNTIRYKLARSDIHYDWSHIVRIMQTQQLQTIQMPSKTKTIHLRKASKPIKEVKQIYDAAGCSQTQKTLKKYVVYH